MVLPRDRTDHRKAIKTSQCTTNNNSPRLGIMMIVEDEEAPGEAFAQGYLRRAHAVAASISCFKGTVSVLGVSMWKGKVSVRTRVPTNG